MQIVKFRQSPKRK